MKNKFPKLRPLSEQLRDSIEDIKAGRVYPMDFSDLEDKKTIKRVAGKRKK